MPRCMPSSTPGNAPKELRPLCDLGTVQSYRENTALHRGYSPVRDHVRVVVIGMLDPNPHVTGGGADYLQARGVEVHSGVLSSSAERSIVPSSKHSATGLPWIIMKAGLSLDGKITIHPRQGGPLTGPESKRLCISCAIRLIPF
jgi:hypothetical protein